MEKITLIYTTDVHGFLVSDKYFQEGYSSHGLLHVVKKLEEIRSEGNECIFFDNGDLFAGSLSSLRFAEDSRFNNPIISLMNDVGCSFSVVGNHEFDFGRDYLNKIIKSSNFPWLTANIVKKSGLELAKHSYHIHTTPQGRKLAFIGLTTPETSELINKEDKKDINFLDIEEVLPQKIAEVKKLGADLIVVVYHGGYDSGLNYWLGVKDSQELKAKIPELFPEIDLFVTGHTHGCIANKEINNVHTIQAGCNGNFLGRIDINFKDEDKNIRSKVIKTDGDIENFSFFKKYKKYLDATEKWLDKVVANSFASYIPEHKEELFFQPSRLSSLIHKSLQAQSNCSISVAHLWSVNGWKKGKVNRKKLINLMPDNDLYILSMFGKDIKLALERTAQFFTFDGRGQSCLSTKFYEYDIWAGVDYTIDIAKEVGSRVVKLQIGGEDINLEKRYNVAVFHFRASGSLGYEMFSKYRPVWKSKNTVRDYFFSYIKTNSRLKVKRDNNFSVVRNNKCIDNAKFTGKHNE